MSDNDSGWKYYQYNPSIAVAGVSSGIFAAISLVHIWLMYRTRAWFLIPLVVGGFFEVGGYAARAYSGSESPDWTLGPYIIQAVLPLVAPALFAASIYMILGKIILMTDGEKYAVIRRRWLTKIFVAGDVISFLVQSGGAGYMSAGSLDAMEIGEYIVIAGLIIQVVIFGIFVVVSYIFHYRMCKSPTQRITTHVLPWQKHLFALYGSSALILVRSIFRVIEYAQGNDGYLFSYEAFMYTLDTLLMFFVLVLFAWIHPGEIRGIIEKVEREDPESRDSSGSVPLEDYSAQPSITK